MLLNRDLLSLVDTPQQLCQHLVTHSFVSEPGSGALFWIILVKVSWARTAGRFWRVFFIDLFELSECGSGQRHVVRQLLCCDLGE